MALLKEQWQPAAEDYRHALKSLLKMKHNRQVGRLVIVHSIGQNSRFPSFLTGIARRTRLYTRTVDRPAV